MPALLLAVLLLLPVGSTLEAQNDPRPRFERRDVPTPSQPYNLEAADLDGDGDVDLATVDQTANTVTIMLNDGSGGFVVLGPIVGFTRPEALAARDFDDDGDVDLAVANAGTNEVMLLINDGCAWFTTGGVTGVGESPHGIVSGDLDGDGDHDLVVSDFRGASVSLLSNDGQGGLGGRPH